MFFALVTAFASGSDTTKGPREIKAVEMSKNMGGCLDQNNHEGFTKLAEEFGVGEWDKKKAEAIIKAAEEVLPQYQQKEK